MGTLSADTLISDILSNQTNSVFTTAYTTRFGTPVYTSAEEGESLTFGTDYFGVDKINDDAAKVSAATEETPYTAKYFYSDKDGNYIGGIKIEGDGSDDNPYKVYGAKGASVQLKSGADDVFMGSVSEDTLIGDILNNRTNTVFTTAYTTRFGTPVYTNAEEGESLTFGTDYFGVETINADADALEASLAEGAEPYTPKYFYTDNKGNYVGGVRITGDGTRGHEYTVNGAKGAAVKVKDSVGDTYLGTLDADTAIPSVLKGEGATFTRAETNRYGNTVALVAEEGESIAFGKADFSANAIETNNDNYYGLASNGAWVKGITVDEQGNVSIQDKASFDITVDGIRYTGILQGEHALDDWTDGLQYENPETGLLKNVNAYGTNPDTKELIRTSEGLTFDKESKTFGGADFSTDAINSNKAAYAVYDDTTGAWIQGIEIALAGRNRRETTILTIEGSTFDVTYEDGTRYTGSLKAGYSAKGLGGLYYDDDNNLINVTAYDKSGKIRMNGGFTFDKETKKFSGADFSRKAINANSQNYSGLAADGAWITGITMDEDGQIFTIDGSTFDITTEDKIRYTGTLKGGFALDNWTDGLERDNDGYLKGVTAYGKNSETGAIVRTSKGLTFDEETKTFGGADFSASAINSDPNAYAAYDENTGVWVEGVRVIGNEMHNVSGAKVLGPDGKTIVELSETGNIANWENTYCRGQLGDLANSVNAQIGDNRLSVGEDGESLVLTKADGTTRSFTMKEIQDGTFLEAMVDLMPKQDNPSYEVPEVSAEDRAIAEEVWYYMYLGSDVEMTDVDAYYVSSIFRAYCSEFGIYDFSEMDSNELAMHASSCANMLNSGYGPLSTLSNLNIQKALDPDDKDHDAYMGEVQITEMYMDRYGAANMAYMVYHAGNPSIKINYVEFLQYKYGLGDEGDKKIEITALINNLYGETMTSYESEIFSSLISAVDYYCEAYDGTRWAVTGIDRAGLSDARTKLENAVNNALDAGLGDNWKMNSECTVITDKYTLLLSDDADIPSGIYTLGIRNDGVYTVIGPDNVFGIKGTYRNVDKDFNQTDDPAMEVIYELGLTDFSGGGKNVFAIDRSVAQNIYLTDDTSYITQQIPNKSEGSSGDDKSNSAVQTKVYNFGVVMDEDVTTYVARGKGTKVTIDMETGGAEIYAEGAKYWGSMTIYANGSNLSDSSGASTINFDSGYMTVHNGQLEVTNNFEASFADEQSATNYVRNYIAPNYTDGTGLHFDSIIDSGGKILPNAGEYLAGMKFNVNPLDYLAVMNNIHDANNDEVGFGIRFKTDNGIANLNDASGIATITTSDIDTIDLFSEKLESGQYIENFQVSGLVGNADAGRIEATNLDPNFKPSKDVELATDVVVGDRISLGTILHRNSVTLSTDEKVYTTGPNGEIIELDGATFGGDETGHFVLADTVSLRGADGKPITYKNGDDVFNIDNIGAGSIIQLNQDKNGGGYGLNVLSGKSDVSGTMQGSVLDEKDPNADKSFLAGKSSALFDGKLTEAEDGKSTTFEGTITGWSTSTMAQDFSKDTFTREGSTWKKDSIVGGRRVTEDAKVDATGNIDSKYYQKTAWEIVGGALAVAAVIAVSVVAAICTLGASLAVEASLLAMVAVGTAAGVAAAIFVAPAAFEHGAGIARCFETGNYDDFGSNLLGLGIDLFSAYMIGTSVGKMGASLLLDGALKETLKATFKTAMKYTFGGAVVGATAGGIIAGVNGGNVLEGIGVGALSGALIGFSTYFGAKTLGVGFNTASGFLGKAGLVTRFAMNTVLDSVILVKTSQSFVHNLFVEGDLRAAASDLLILVSVGIINPISQYNGALKARNAAPPSKVDAKTLFERGKANVTAGLVGGNRVTNALFTGLSVGVAIPLMNLMGTIAQNFMNGREIFEGIDLKGLAVEFGIGFVAGFTIGVINPQLGYNWSTRNIWGTIGEVVYNPASVLQKGITSGIDLMRFNVLSPILNAIVAPITGKINNWLNAGNEGYEAFDYGDFWNSWGKQFSSIGDKYNLMLFGDLDDQNGWAAVKSSFGTGFFQSHFFGMAIPGAAIFKAATYEEASLLSKVFTVWGEGGITALPSLVLGGKWMSFTGGAIMSMITKPINMLQYSVAEKLFGGLGKNLDDMLADSAFYGMLENLGLSSFQKGEEEQGLFEYVFGSAAMLFVPSAMRATSWSTERDMSKLKKETKGGTYSETAKKILENQDYFRNKNALEVDMLLGAAIRASAACGQPELLKNLFKEIVYNYGAGEREKGTKLEGEVLAHYQLTALKVIGSNPSLLYDILSDSNSNYGFVIENGEQVSVKDAVISNFASATKAMIEQAKTGTFNINGRELTYSGLFDEFAKTDAGLETGMKILSALDKLYAEDALYAGVFIDALTEISKNHENVKDFVETLECKQQQEALEKAKSAIETTHDQIRDSWNNLSAEQKKAYHDSESLYLLSKISEAKGSLRIGLTHFLDWTDVALLKTLASDSFKNVMQEYNTKMAEFTQNIQDNLMKDGEAAKQFKGKDVLETKLDLGTGVKISFDIQTLATMKFDLAHASIYGYGESGISASADLTKVYQNFFGEDQKVYDPAKGISAAKDGKVSATEEQMVALFNSCLEMQIGNCLSGGYGFSKELYEGINGIFNNTILRAFRNNAAISSEDMKEVLTKIQEINVFGTGAGKTSVVAVLFPSLKLVNDIQGEFTIICADIDTNVNNLLKRVGGLYGNKYEMLKADKDNITSDLTTKTALFMTYTDFGFAMLDANSPLKGKVGLILGDEADMAVYLSKVMSSSSSGFESKDSDMYKFFTALTDKDGSGQYLQKAVEQMQGVLKGDAVYKSMLEKLDRFKNNTLTEKDITDIRTDLESLLAKVGADSSTGIKIKSILEGFTIVDGRVVVAEGSASAEMLGLVKVALEMSINERTKVLLSNDSYSEVYKSQYEQILEEFVKEISGVGNKNDLFGSGYSLQEVLNNVLMSKLTWTYGVDYGIGKAEDGSYKVMLICNGALIDLVPGVGYKQIVEAEILNGMVKGVTPESIGGMTGIGDREHSSIAIIQAIREASGFIGLTGTYSASAQQAMGFDANYYTPATSVKLTDVTSYVDKGDKVVALHISQPAQTSFGAFEKAIVSILNGDITIMALNNQAKIDLFKDYTKLLGVLSDRDCSVDETGQAMGKVAWFDAGMSKEMGLIYADNKAGQYKCFIGTYEQLGRGVDIHIENVEGVDKNTHVNLYAVDAHLSYKSAVEQLVGRVLGTRFSDQAQVTTDGRIIKNINVYFESDISTINTYYADKEKAVLKESIPSQVTNNQYLDLINARVYGSDYSGREAEDRVVAQSGALNYNAKGAVSQADRPYVRSTADLEASLSRMGLNSSERSEVVRVLQTQGLHNGYELTERGSVSVGYALQMLGYTQTGYPAGKSSVATINAILGNDIKDVPTVVNKDAVISAINNVVRLQSRDVNLLTTNQSNGNTLNDIISVMPVVQRGAATDAGVDIASVRNALSIYSHTGVTGVMPQFTVPEISAKTTALHQAVQHRDNVQQQHQERAENLSANPIVRAFENWTMGVESRRADSQVARAEKDLAGIKQKLFNDYMNGNLDGQNVPVVLAMFNDQTAALQNAIQNRTDIQQQQQDRMESLSTNPIIRAFEKFTMRIEANRANSKVTEAEKTLNEMKQKLFEDYMNGNIAEQDIPIVLDILNSQISSGKLVFGNNSVAQTLENLRSNENFNVDWLKTDRNRVLQYLGNGDMVGLTEYLSTTQRAKIPVLSSMKDKQQMAQIIKGEQVNPIVTMAMNMLFLPVTILESIVTLFKSPALSLSDDQKTLLEGLRGKKNVTVNDVVKLANTDIPNYSATTIPTQEEIDRASEERLRSLFAIIRPDVSADTLLARYQYVRDNSEFGVLDSITVDMLANDTLFDGNIANGNFEEEYGKLLGKLTYDELKELRKNLNSPERKALANAGINYSRKENKADNVASNYAYVVRFLKRQGLTDEQAKQLAGSFTLEELNSTSLGTALDLMVVQKGLIKIDADTNTTREDLIKAIRKLTNEQLRNAGVEIADISPLLTWAGLDAGQIQMNDGAIAFWMSRSEVVREFGDKIEFKYEASMVDLSSVYFQKDIMGEDYTVTLKKQFEGMTYTDYTETDVAAKLNLKETREFFKFIGLDYDNVVEAYDKLREQTKSGRLSDIEAAIAENMADRAMGIKEFNEEVLKQLAAALNNFAGSATLAQLSDPKYVAGMEALIGSDLITVDDVIRGKDLVATIKEKSIGDVRNILGTQYYSAMRAFGLEIVFDNVTTLEEKYTSDAERAIISEMKISELININSLLKDENVMRTRLTNFAKTATMADIERIAEREAKEGENRDAIRRNIVGIVNDLFKDKHLYGYATYDDISKELAKQGIDTKDIAIKTIIDNSNIVEEVKFLKNNLNMDSAKITEIIRNAKGVKTITDAIKGMTLNEFESLTEGMSQENKDKLYEYLGMNRKTIEKKISVLRSRVNTPEELAKDAVTIGEIDRAKDVKVLANRVDIRVERKGYQDVTVEKYLGLSEEDRAKYGKDKGRIDRRIRELTSEGEEQVLRGYIVGEMRLKDILGEGVAEKKIADILDKTDMHKYYDKTRRYYENMTAEEFMKATQVLGKDGKVNVTQTTAKRRGILGDEGYKSFITNYNTLSRKARFKEGVKGVSVEVLEASSADVYRAIEKVAGTGKLNIEDAAKVEIVKEEPKAEQKATVAEAKTPEQKVTETPVVSQAEEKADVEDCVDVAVETMGKIIPLRALTESALRATPYAQDKLKAAGVEDTLEGTELGELRQRIGLRYATLSEQDIDLRKLNSREVKKAPVTVYIPETGEVLTITGIKAIKGKDIKDRVVTYTITTPEGEEISGEKKTGTFEEEGLSGVVVPSAFIAYKENAGKDTGHVITITEIAGGYLTYTGTDANGKKIEETISIDEFFKEKGFTGLMLTQKGQKGVRYLDSGVKEVIEDMFKGKKMNRYGAGKEMLANIIDGVTAPGELNKALKYVLSIWNKDATAMLKYIGLNEGALGNKEKIIQNATRKITEAIALGKEGKLSEAEVKVEIELVTTLRDLLITTGRQDADWLKTASDEEIMAKLIVSKAVNQNVIVNMFEQGVKTSVSDAKDGDFVIDVKKLQSTIVDKNLKFAKDAKIEDVMELLAGADKKYMTPMMNFNLRNIHAVAAAA